MNFGIIAAGEGSRLVQEGVALPKPLVSIDGRPMIGRLLRIFERMGAERIAVIVNQQMTDVRRYIEDYTPAPGVTLDLVVKSTPSSMHSFGELAALLRGHGRFILTTVDTIFREEDFERYVRAFRQAPADVDGMMAVTQYVDDEKPLYVGVADEPGHEMEITAFRDTPAPGDRYISGGIYGLDSRAIGVLDGCLASGQSRMRNFQRALVEAGLRLKAHDMGKVLDVDHASDIAKAEEYITAATPQGDAARNDNRHG